MIDEQMHAVELPEGTTIRPCPCFGAAASIQAVSQYGTCGFIAACPKCHIRSLPVMVTTNTNYLDKKLDVTFTKEEAISELLKIWNRRVSAM